MLQKATDKGVSRPSIHATIITVNEDQEVSLGCALLIQNYHISTIDKISNLNSNVDGSTEVSDCTNKIIIPDLINTYAHLAQLLLHGLTKDFPIKSWL